ncbi:Proteasome maturation protein [Turdus rufiventris]|nr:Proteasome maturation protein [Turdus rufiventris]
MLGKEVEDRTDIKSFEQRNNPEIYSSLSYRLTFTSYYVQIRQTVVNNRHCPIDGAIFMNNPKITSIDSEFQRHYSVEGYFTSVKNELLPSHPLELTEKNFQLNQDKTNFATLRNIQGIHAPLKLQMEFRAVKQVQRLPFLHSSNIAMDILRGNDECIGFEDILNDPSQSEVMGEPHIMMEHKLGLL